MKILIDIGHPAHVHLFKNFAGEMIKKEHKILFTLRQKEFSEQLLNHYGFDFLKYGSSYTGIVGKIWGLFKFNFALFKIVKKYKPDITLSHSSFYLAQVSWLSGVNNITLEDTGNMEQVLLYKPFANCILSPDCYKKNHGKKHINYRGYHELAYLFSFTPNYIKNELDIKPKEKFALLRFVSWNATHDVGQGGLSISEKEEIVKFLSSKMKLFISAERTVPSYFEKYLIKIKPEQIHHVLAFAEIVISEGATMASECAVLGTPVIYVNTMNAGTIDEQEEYGLLFHYHSGKGVLDKVKELLNTPNLKEEWQKRRQKMLKDKIDFTAFLVWFIENYPQSANIMKENPDYQYRFK